MQRIRSTTFNTSVSLHMKADASSGSSFCCLDSAGVAAHKNPTRLNCMSERQVLNVRRIGSNLYPSRKYV
jgi:hypothetical protein